MDKQLEQILKDALGTAITLMQAATNLALDTQKLVQKKLNEP